MYIAAHGSELAVRHSASPALFVLVVLRPSSESHCPGVPMPTTDRRHASRTKLEQVAYIHIEPDNGAIVLNASGDGLGFHSMAPVDPTAPLRFSVQEQNRRVDICGELVWTDELQKIGGVRFDTLTAEAREQILDWIRTSGPAAAERSTLGAALLKALPATASHRSAYSIKPALAWWKSGTGVKVSGYARGLASGFLLSLLAFSVALFSYAHRRQLGDSLVRLGERLGASRDSGSPLRTAPSGTATLATTPAAAVSVKPAARVEAVNTAKRKSSFTTIPAKHQIASADQIRPAANPVPVRVPSPVQSTHLISPRPELQKTNPSRTKFPTANDSGSSQRQPLPPAVTPPGIDAVISPVQQAHISAAKADQLPTFIHSEAVVPVSLGVSPLNTRSDVQMFFDVGRFKKDWMAQDLSNKVAQLGIRTSVVQRGHLWMSSYQVLAGPYNNEAAEKQLREELRSHGYDPRPYERGSRGFSIRSKVNIHGSQLPAGDFSIAWETYVADTKVKFRQGGHLIAAVDGKWVRCDTKFLNNEYVYRIQHDRSRPLLELHFAGMNRILLLHNMP